MTSLHATFLGLLICLSFLPRESKAQFSRSVAFRGSAVPKATGGGGGGGGGSHTLLAHTAKAAGTTDAINTTGATLLVAEISYGSSVGTFSDNKGNTWTGLTIHGTGNRLNRIYYCINPTSVGSGHTFTSTSDNRSICVMAFDGTFTAFDAENGATLGSPANSVHTGSVTPSQNGEVIVASMTFYEAPNTPSMDTGFTLTDNIQPGSTYGAGFAYLVQTTAAAVNPTWTLSQNSNGGSAGIACFK